MGETTYRLVKKRGSEIILLNESTGKHELWFRQDGPAGKSMIIDGETYMLYGERSDFLRAGFGG